MLAGVQLEQPGGLLLRRLGPRRAEGVAVAIFGLSLVLGMLITLAVLVEWSLAWQADARRHLAEHNGQLSVDWGIAHSLRWRNATEGLPLTCNRRELPFPNQAEGR